MTQQFFEDHHDELLGLRVPDAVTVMGNVQLEYHHTDDHRLTCAYCGQPMERIEGKRTRYSINRSHHPSTITLERLVPGLHGGDYREQNIAYVSLSAEQDTAPQSWQVEMTQS